MVRLVSPVQGVVPGLPAEIVPRCPFLLSPSDQSRAGVLDADQPGLVTTLVWVQVVPHRFGGQGNHKHDSLGPGSWPRRIQSPPVMRDTFEPGLAAGDRRATTLAPLVGSIITIFERTTRVPKRENGCLGQHTAGSSTGLQRSSGTHMRQPLHLN